MFDIAPLHSGMPGAYDPNAPPPGMPSPGMPWGYDGMMYPSFYPQYPMPSEREQGYAARPEGKPFPSDQHPQSMPPYPGMPPPYMMPYHYPQAYYPGQYYGRPQAPYYARPPHTGHGGHAEHQAYEFEVCYLSSNPKCSLAARVSGPAWLSGPRPPAVPAARTPARTPAPQASPGAEARLSAAAVLADPAGSPVVVSLCFGELISVPLLITAINFFSPKS